MAVRGPRHRPRLRERGRCDFALRAEVSGIKKLLMGAAFQKTMDSEVEATERLKSVLESVPDE